MEEITTEIRWATLMDANEIQSIILDAYSEYQDIPGSSSALDETVDSIAKSLEFGNERALLGFADDIAVASVRYTFESGLYFYRLAVRRRYQGRGFAKLLLQCMEALAIKEKEHQIWCKVRYSVPRNVYLYRSLGYEKTDEETIVKDNGMALPVWTMNKKLPAV